MELCEGNGGKEKGKEPWQKARGLGLKQDQGGIGVYTVKLLWLSSVE